MIATSKKQQANTIDRFTLEQLLTGIFSKLSALFSIDCAALILYEKDTRQISKSYLTIADSSGKYSCKENISELVNFSPIDREISAFQFPVLKSRQDWAGQFGENHQLLNHPAEYYFHCYLPLELDHNRLATFELHNLKKEFSAEALNFCSMVSDLLLGLLSAAINDPEELTDSAENCKPDEDICIESDIQQIYHYPEIAGNSLQMQQVFRLIDKVSNTDTTVLILGDTGTGKELIAKAIHNGSGRKQNDMVKINCAAIPPNLIESELFGHEKGSFTGATERRIGKFEQASKSTIFLDEVGELSPDMQVKLLRVIQEKEFQRVGGKDSIYADVRIISATNRNLLEEVEAGRFRSDLYYRLHVFPVALPSLRERKSDIPVLATYFLMRFNAKFSKHIAGFSKEVITKMKNYSWPGNVREMEHLVERQVLLTQGHLIKDLDIPGEGKGTLAHHVAGSPVKTIFENERDHIFSVLERCHGKISGPFGAAKLLGIPATTLNSKIKRLGLVKKHSF